MHAQNEVKLGLGHLIFPYEVLLEVTSSTWTIAGEFSFDFFKEISVTTRKHIGHLQRYEAERWQPKIRKNVSNTQQLASYKLKKNFAIRYGYQNQEILSLADKLETEVKSLMTFLSSKNRNRRCLVDLKGDLLQFLFGTASERDVARTSKALDQLELAGKKNS